MTKVLTIVGTRPELIRLSLVIGKLDKHCNHILVHTGQNYDDKLSKIFFDELGIRQPDYYLGVKRDTFGSQVGEILSAIYEIFGKEQADRVLVLGDTNSGLSSIVARRMGIPVYHMEAGNRCFDKKVPEETNRIIIDHCSTIHMPYTQRSKENLLKEGIPLRDIYVIGNPICEVLKTFSREVHVSNIIESLDIRKNNFFLLTVHRAENVDNKDRLTSIFLGARKILDEYHLPIVCSIHPRTKDKLNSFGIKTSGLFLCEPFGFFDFVKLENEAKCVITDSGTVQEETCILGIPAVTIRDTTERQETIECGSNILCGTKPEDLLDAVNIALENKNKWNPPLEYLVDDVSTRVIKIVLGSLPT